MYYLFIGGLYHGMFTKGTGEPEMQVSLEIDGELHRSDYILKEGHYIADGMPKSEYDPVIKQYRQNLPICHVCKKPIDGISTERLSTVGAAVYVYHCHGEQERIVIKDDDVRAGINMDFSVAFDHQVKKI